MFQKSKEGIEREREALEYKEKMTKEAKRETDKALRYCKENNLKPKLHKFEGIYKIRFYTFKSYYKCEENYNMQLLNEGGMWANCSEKIMNAVKLIYCILKYGEKDQHNIYSYKIKHYVECQNREVFFDSNKTELYFIYIKEGRKIKEKITERTNKKIIFNLMNDFYKEAERVMKELSWIQQIKEEKEFREKFLTHLFSSDFINNSSASIIFEKETGKNHLIEKEVYLKWLRSKNRKGHLMVFGDIDLDVWISKEEDKRKIEKRRKEIDEKIEKDRLERIENDREHRLRHQNYMSENLKDEGLLPKDYKITVVEKY